MRFLFLKKSNVKNIVFPYILETSFGYIPVCKLTDSQPSCIYRGKSGVEIFSNFCLS